MRGLRGKRVLISGGSSGIGFAAAARFLEEGSRVFLGGADPAEVEAAVAGLATGGKVAGGEVGAVRQPQVRVLVVERADV